MRGGEFMYFNTCFTFKGSLTGAWSELDLRDFWISWTNGELSVGQTRLKGHQRRLVLTQPRFDVDALGFYPSEDGPLEWQFLHWFGKKPFTRKHLLIQPFIQTFRIG